MYLAEAWEASCGVAEAVCVGKQCAFGRHACAGLDGCSHELGVLKRSRGTATTTRMAPQAALLELAAPVTLVGTLAWCSAAMAAACCLGVFVRC